MARVAFGPGDDLFLEGEDGAGEAHDADGQAGDEAGDEVGPEEDFAEEFHGRMELEKDGKWSREGSEGGEGGRFDLVYRGGAEGAEMKAEGERLRERGKRKKRSHISAHWRRRLW